MYFNTLNISSKGQIVLPKKIRDVLQSNVISVEINEYNQVVISPIHDLGGSLSAYQQPTSSSFGEIRNQAWKVSISEAEKRKSF